MANNDRAFDWEDEINQQADFVVLEPGDYDFTVEMVDRSEYNGSAKMPACKMAIVHLRIVDPQTERDVTVRHNFFCTASAISCTGGNRFAALNR